jgi:hypothetical protein
MSGDRPGEHVPHQKAPGQQEPREQAPPDQQLRVRRVERFRRLMAAQERIAEALAPHGVTDAQLQAALAAAEEALPRDPDDDRDFYHPALERYVAVLGGRLEGEAIFPDVTVDLDGEPGRHRAG